MATRKYWKAGYVWGVFFFSGHNWQYIINVRNLFSHCEAGVSRTDRSVTLIQVRINLEKVKLIKLQTYQSN